MQVPALPLVFIERSLSLARVACPSLLRYRVARVKLVPGGRKAEMNQEDEAGANQRQASGEETR